MMVRQGLLLRLAMEMEKKDMMDSGSLVWWICYKDGVERAVILLEVDIFGAETAPGMETRGRKRERGKDRKERDIRKYKQ